MIFNVRFSCELKYFALFKQKNRFRRNLVHTLRKIKHNVATWSIFIKMSIFITFYQIFFVDFLLSIKIKANKIQ
jgi:hypothetical protein